MWRFLTSAPACRETFPRGFLPPRAQMPSSQIRAPQRSEQISVKLIVKNPSSPVTVRLQPGSVILRPEAQMQQPQPWAWACHHSSSCHGHGCIHSQSCSGPSSQNLGMCSFQNSSSHLGLPSLQSQCHYPTGTTRDLAFSNGWCQVSKLVSLTLLRVGGFTILRQLWDVRWAVPRVLDRPFCLHKASSTLLPR